MGESDYRSNPDALSHVALDRRSLWSSDHRCDDLNNGGNNGVITTVSDHNNGVSNNGVRYPFPLLLNNGVSRADNGARR